MHLIHCPRFDFSHYGTCFILLCCLAKYSVTLTTQWPAGQYGLPMPVSGCPNANFSWLTGWRYQDTEDKTPSNRQSDSLHIEGFVRSSSVNKSFCMKTNISQDSSLSHVWPNGKYCIYKREGYCPQGLQSGLITWDDEDNENANSYSGELPNGYYQGSRTTIQYCCSVQGVKANPISLPVDTPFYLLAYHSTQCQQVQWALATQEWIHYDTENGVNSDSKLGDYPFGAMGGVDGHTIHYCYYTSCRYVLNFTSGTIQSPGFPNKYPNGQLCSWRITVQSDRIVSLHFMNFSMAMSSHGDMVEIYDGNDDNAKLVGSYHGDSIPGDIKSSSSSLYLVFRSDGTVSGRGFQAYYVAVDPKGCRYVLNFTSGTIQSPGFPNKYPNGQLCSWRITVQSDRIVSLHFMNFSMATSSRGDMVEIYDGNDDNAKLVGSYHGDSVPGDIKSSSSSLYLVFRSDGTVSGRGFQAYYVAVDPKEPVPSTEPSHPWSTSTRSEPTTEIMNNVSTSEGPVVKKSCLKGSTSPSIAVVSIVVPLICLIGTAVLVAFMLYRWRTIRSRKKGLSVIYQAKTTSNPSYFGVVNTNNHNKKEDELSIVASKGEEKDDIYQEVGEKRITNPLYDSQDDLATGNPIYQHTDTTSTNTCTLYDSYSIQ